ncbi:uncharacterized protein LOC142166999 [Nicotiana tabacum]|uniref:Uncharacterized protein LOC142166999 n=1 Tax=Nicotiana tabacum TaxID=4097 RepID=A0AC58SE50_TOBAC
MRRYRNARRGRIPPRRTMHYNEKDINGGKCYKCGRFGHVQAECPDLKTKVSIGFNKNKSFESWSNKDSSEHEEIANLCFMTVLENNMKKSQRVGHMRTLQMKCKDDNENCFMARGETSKNLLSISQLCDSGHEVKFKKIGCAIEDETGQIILPDKRYGNVYILDGFENMDGHICLTFISDDPWLWNKKLGHASMHLIEKLFKHDLVIDIVSTSKPLQLLHMNLFRSTITASIGGKRLKEKRDILLQQFKVIMEENLKAEHLKISVMIKDTPTISLF